MAKTPLPNVGLCSVCRHARRVITPRSVFWMCRLAATDPRFERYPQLPVERCPGYQPGESEDAPLKASR